MTMTTRIKAAMQERGVTQSELAATTGMSPTQLARMLRDDDHNYTMRTLTRIAAALGTTLDIEFTDTAAATEDDPDQVWVPIAGISSVSPFASAAGGFCAPLEPIYDIPIRQEGEAHE